MLNILTVTPAQWALIGFILATLYVISTIFDAHVARQLDTDPMGTHSGINVVFGTCYVLTGASLILAMIIGTTTLVVAAVLFLCFAAAGIPMLMGDISRGERSRGHSMEAMERKIEALESEIVTLRRVTEGEGEEWLQ